MLRADMSTPLRSLPALLFQGLFIVGTLACQSDGNKAPLYVDTSSEADGTTPDLDSDTSDDEPRDSGPDTGSPPIDADGDGYTIAEGDCDDADPAIHPDAAEVCDGGLDNDCNDLADDDDPGLDLDSAFTWYLDGDGDGHGDEVATILSCVMPEGHVAWDAAGFDCDDTDPAFYPGAVEDDCTDRKSVV
jgi:hypothetical protein